MSAFKRAEWHSGLTYQQTCTQCQLEFKYQDYVLDFRPWYADGFVYCPRCKRPLRHRESYAINVPEDYNKMETTLESNNENAYSYKPNFCTKCGYKFNEDDAFCPQCGNKR